MPLPSWQAYLPPGIPATLKVTESTVSLTTSASQVLTPDPNRILVVFSAAGTGTIQLATTKAGAAAGGIQLDDGTPVHVFTALQHLLLPSLGWWGKGATGGETVSIIDVSVV